jgi:hypothetical protein
MIQRPAIEGSHTISGRLLVASVGSGGTACWKASQLAWSSVAVLALGPPGLQPKSKAQYWVERSLNGLGHSRAALSSTAGSVTTATVSVTMSVPSLAKSVAAWSTLLYESWTHPPSPGQGGKVPVLALEPFQRYVRSAPGLGGVGKLFMSVAPRTTYAA